MKKTRENFPLVQHTAPPSTHPPDHPPTHTLRSLMNPQLIFLSICARLYIERKKGKDTSSDAHYPFQDTHNQARITQSRLACGTVELLSHGSAAHPVQ
jgi:hypothetical protein